MKKMLALVISLSLANGLFAGVNFDGNSKIDIKKMSENIEVPSVKTDKKVTAKNEKEWTIMVYLNAKNNLERFGISDLNEMETVGSNDKFNIIVEFGRLKGYDSTNGDWTGVRRYYVTKDNDKNIINSTLVQDLGEVDMGDYKTLIDFVKWAKKNYPAKKYALVIWNHGSGWEKGVNPITRGISYDDVSGNHINTPQLGLAMKEIGYVDVLDFDACLMQMAEVGYEIKDHVKYIVASEETEPGDGDTYDVFLKKLEAKPDMGPYELSKAIVDAYADHYASVNDGTTKSVVRAEKLDEFIKLVNEFAYTVSQKVTKDVVKEAVRGAQSYAINDNKDLYHFAKLISEKSSDNEVKAKAEELMNFISKKLVAYNRYTNSSGSWWGPSDYSNSYGIAVYLPSYSIGVGYLDLQWSKYTNWDEFIKWYLNK